MYIYCIEVVVKRPDYQGNDHYEIEVIANNKDEALFRAGNALGMREPYQDIGGLMIWIKVLHKELYTKH